jgi:hypothetical protein
MQMTQSNNSEREGDALDMRDRFDRSKLAEAIRRGWAVDPARKARYMAALDELIDNRKAEFADDPAKRADVVMGANRIYQLEQAAALKDLHQLEHDARIDDGKPTERVDGVIFKVPGMKQDE